MTSETYGQLTCPRETGFCLTPDGKDQNSGVYKINGEDFSAEAAQTECLNLCLARDDATGCEVILKHDYKGCYVHTKSVAEANSAQNHFCWVFSKCTKGE